MPCYDSRNDECESARRLHHDKVEELVERLIETRDVDAFEVAFREEQRLYQADVDSISTGRGERRRRTR